MRFTKEEQAMWLEDWRQSGKKAWAYAKENGLSPQTFSRWIKAKKENWQSFVEVPAQTITPVQLERKILIEKGDVKIHIPLCLNSVELQAVMTSLGRAL
jgi:transposase-like protein